MADNNDPPAVQGPGAPRRQMNPQAELMRLPIVTDAIAEGRISQDAYARNCKVKVSTVDLDGFATRLIAIMLPAFRSWDLLHQRYMGSFTEILEDIETDVTAVVNAAMQGLYNRLRAIAEDQHPSTKLTRMNARAPHNARNLYPSLLARYINSVGYLRIEDGPYDTKVVYATSAGTAANFGRNAATPINSEHYHRLMTALARIGASTSTIDFTSTPGSYWTTCRTVFNENQGYFVYATLHRSHYTNEDAVLGLILAADSTTVPPFKDFGFFADKVTIAAVSTALAEARPTGLPAAFTATGSTRYNHALFAANRFGLIPAEEAGGTASCYVIGRGTQRYYNTILYRNCDESERDAIFLQGFRSLSR